MDNILFNKTFYLELVPFFLYYERHIFLNKIQLVIKNMWLILSNFFQYTFTSKTRHFQVCLKVWSRGLQVRSQPCKLGNLAIFYQAKKPPKIYLFFCFHERKEVRKEDRTKSENSG